MKQRFTRRILLLLLLAFSLPSLAQTAEERSRQHNLDHGLALQGYDPVAYFSEKRAVRGSDRFSARYEGVTYHFATDANRRRFLETPARYEPQYGGWCAFAMGDYGKKVEVDPETFKVTDGKLYLFYNAYLTNTLKSWNKDEARLRANADRNWSGFIKSPVR